MTNPSTITVSICPHDENGVFHPERCSTMALPVFSATRTGQPVQTVQQPAPSGARNAAFVGCTSGHVGTLSMPSAQTYQVGCLDNSGNETSSSIFKSAEGFKGLLFIPQ